MRAAPVIVLDDCEREELRRLAQGRTTPVRQKKRATIILLAADGWTNQEIAGMTGATGSTVRQWRNRFAEMRLEGMFEDLPRSGRPRAQCKLTESEIIRITTQVTPKNDTHWSAHALAEELGISPYMVQRIWKANGLKPNPVRTFKLSSDPDYEEKLIDVVGLYLNPPEQSLVLSAEEKSQIQAVDLIQPGLPVLPDQCGTLIQDDKRNATTTLFAAIEKAHGKIIATRTPRHRRLEWIKFLEQINAETPLAIDLHLIVYNCATHKHLKVQGWLDRHPRFHVHFIRTSRSWPRITERFFRELDEKRTDSREFRSAPQLLDAIMDYIRRRNTNHKPFIWRKTPDEIVVEVGRAALAREITPSA